MSSDEYFLTWTDGQTFRFSLYGGDSGPLMTSLAKALQEAGLAPMLTRKEQTLVQVSLTGK